MNAYTHDAAAQAVAAAVRAEAEAEGFRKGAEWMRERAALYLDNCEIVQEDDFEVGYNAAVASCASSVRALPLEPEKERGSD